MNNEKRPVIISENRPTAYSPIMTLRAAKRYAEQMMPADLRRAGFSAGVFVSDAEIHGGSWYRVGFGKKVPA